MHEKRTDELENVLGSTHVKKIKEFLEDNKNEMLMEEKPFSSYMRTLIQKKGLNRQNIFLLADIPERYGYKLLSEEKRTRQRDIIIRLCYAAEFTVEETQEALRIYGMPELYARIPRDAVLMICFNERPGSIIDVNRILSENGMESLRTSGVQQ